MEGEMVDDRSIFRTAEGLLRIRGEKAVMECAEMVNRWTSRGDMVAADVWRRVMNEIRNMQRQRTN